MTIENSTIWTQLESLAKQAKERPLLDFFDEDPQRADSFKIDADGLYFDYSKTAINGEARAALLALAELQGVDDLKQKMFAGAPINTTEGRAVLHTALRAPKSAAIHCEGRNISDEVHSSLEHMQRLCRAVSDGTWHGYSGAKITDVVHIGIGGSDLGPYMVCDALKNYASTQCSVHFVSNVDGAALTTVLNRVAPETTLFLIASKSFTTQETLKNAHSARQWFLEKTKADDSAIAQHFIAMTVNTKAALDFGINAENILPFGDYVGGRFSLWSSIGLPIALAIGFDNFSQLLAGAHAMDQHFLHAPAAENIPLMLGLVGIWHRNFCEYETLAILPYAQDLQSLPAYLQQMDMESNGKEIDKTGRALPFDTGPVIFGASGTNGQHAFYQLIHQSKTVIPCEFIAFKQSLSPLKDHHDTLLAHVIAQSRALMIGTQSAPQSHAPEKAFNGNRPSTTLIIDKLTPYSLGQLLALYEHKIFVQGAVWGLNSFDQPGVELGKVLAAEIAQHIDALQNETSSQEQLDGSTQKLLKHIYCE
jgi:glucose-6-phosphate isomerase